MNQKTQTRGRPKKKSDQKLPQISRKLFSQHCAVFYACCMVYVLQTFFKTKHQKRIGHSQGGFTIYQRLNQSYCFQNVQKDCKLWGLQIIIKKPLLMDFVKIVNGCAPKFVFKELLLLIQEIVDFLQSQKIQSIQTLKQKQYKLWNRSQIQTNKKYKYIRFSFSALKELNMQKWNDQISMKIKELWQPFITIISYSVFCVINNKNTNKYLKPFFSDAEHPQETIIGQLNLQQIVDLENDYVNQKICQNHVNEKTYESPSKIIKTQTSQKDGLKYKKDSFEIQADQQYRYSSPQNNRQLSQSSRLINSNIRPVTLITHPSIQFSEQKNDEISQQKQKSFNLNSPSKQNLLSNFNGFESNISIQDQMEAHLNSKTKIQNQKKEQKLMKSIKQLQRTYSFSLTDHKRLQPVTMQHQNMNQQKLNSNKKIKTLT